MKSVALKSFFYFISIVASFQIDGYRDHLAELDELDKAVITLGEEIYSNIDYAKEHLQQVKNLRYMNEFVVANFYTFTIKELENIHDNNPFLHVYDLNNQINYIKKYSPSTTEQLLGGWLAFEPDNIFFQSMLNSGDLLSIKNPALAKEIQSLYTKQSERVKGMALFTGELGNNVLDWFVSEQNKYNTDISFNEVLIKNRNQKLKNVLVFKLAVLNDRITDIENYIHSLQNCVKIISEEYKAI